MFRSKKKDAIKRTERKYENMLISESTPFAISESFKMLRQNLFFTSSGESCPVYAITSSYAHTGKSVIIANTAASYAELDKKVLVIDGDMRCPVLHKIFGKSSNKGLSELLASSDSLDAALPEYIVESGKAGLDVILSGRIPPNPSELLSSKRMQELMDTVKEKYDIVFIDMPPICEVSDAGAVSGFITGYLFAVRSGITDDRSVSDALEILEQVNAKVIGFVLNDVNPKLSGKSYEKYGKYGKYSKYGYRRNEESSNK